MAYFNRVRIDNGAIEDGRTIAPGERTWRELPEDSADGTEIGNWTDAQKRLPEESDADEFGCVLAFHAFNGVMVTGWKQFRENGYLTHWQRTPKPPKTFRQLWEEYEKGPRVRE